ncbi:hypothetical protein J437_LFUL015677 [Ladona fulva]|uniref:Uncharacterized protein n=1 Tax=Ladona fulva TaxID=123851 RepID=A0A8K0KGW9_LADFU|nr:hypothetical protein J437_LFUL015677 [Ladona fulva]
MRIPAFRPLPHHSCKGRRLADAKAERRYAASPLAILSRPVRGLFDLQGWLSDFLNATDSASTLQLGPQGCRALVRWLDFLLPIKASRDRATAPESRRPAISVSTRVPCVAISFSARRPDDLQKETPEDLVDSIMGCVHRLLFILNQNIPFLREAIVGTYLLVLIALGATTRGLQEKRQGGEITAIFDDFR